MIRKFAIAFAAIAALGTASLALTTVPASAGGGKGGGFGGFHHHHGHFRGGYGFGLYPVDTCYKQVWVLNRRGETVLRTIYVCD